MDVQVITLGLLHPDEHIKVRVESGDKTWTGCGHSWCNGECEIPALVVNLSDFPLQKVHSSMVAVGPVLQPFRVKWIGKKIELPAEVGSELFTKKWW